jgi:penicillin-binding protein 1C
MFRDRSLIRTSLDLGMQHTVEGLLSQRLPGWHAKGVLNAAVIVAENSSRRVRAYLGSPEFSDAASRGQVDAVKARRSPGSTLKPFLFAHEMERGVLTPKTRLLDTPYDVEGFLAENYDGTYSGLVYADEALRRSLNVPMIRLLRQAGIGSFLDLLGKAGFASLQDQRPRMGLSLILGGCGVSLDELVAGYMTFPNSGEYAPLCYEAEAAEPTEGVRVFSAPTAYMVTEILEGLDRPDLPNNFASAINLPAVAFKTGTSYGRRDAWAIGYSSEFTVGVWVGDVRGIGNAELVGSKFAAPLLIDILNSLSRRRTKAILAVPADIRIREVCARSGLVPGIACTEHLEDLYAFSRTTQATCTMCREELVSKDHAITYCPSCLGDHPYDVVRVAEYPPDLVHFLRSRGENPAGAPPHNPACTRVFTGEGPTIVSPSDGMTYYVMAEKQKICLQATTGVTVKDLFWYVDQRFLGRRPAGDKLFVHLDGGGHLITCVDDAGRTNSIRVNVRLVNS